MRCGIARTCPPRDLLGHRFDLLALEGPALTHEVAKKVFAGFRARKTVPEDVMKLPQLLHMFSARMAVSLVTCPVASAPDHGFV
jgi:hypothetical protein